MSTLSHLGMLEARVGDGTYVRAANELEAVMRNRMNSLGTGSILDIRRALDEFSPIMAAESYGKQYTGEVERARMEVSEACRLSQFEELFNIDRTIRFTIIRMTGNNLLAELYTGIDKLIKEPCVVFSDPEANQSYPVRILSLYIELLDAIEGGCLALVRDVSYQTNRARRYLFKHDAH
ncbi:hypothetical protein BJF89_17015 [Corynebacterium sp. CNJ-954]|nr:hypothetical protein BJF89_17015 [Corynebacterium sp. CNJ-954]